MTEQQHYRVVEDRDKGDDPIEQWRANGVAYFKNRAHGEVGEWWLNQIQHIFGAESLAAVRIERPVPTTDEPDIYVGLRVRRKVGRALVTYTVEQISDVDGGVVTLNDGYQTYRERFWGEFELLPSPHPPTREQIAEALAEADGFPLAWRGFLGLADAVLTLIQNGADR